ncbi:MAG: universal stress protein [Alphaproteobacteria bacterium HGW-Alphaproteobacteria-2]|nr:MAG: universal stress protein [Alphaproteobacteria bacterium HGW-Alphaproteobacteria-2]
MPNVLVVGYDDSSAGQRALDFAAERARQTGATLVVAHVLEWSPYSFLTVEELAERHKRREAELTRAQQAIVEPVLGKLHKAGLEARGELRYGHIADTLIAIAVEVGASEIVIGRTGESGITARVFGSVAGTLAQAAPVPCTIVP